MKISIRIKNKQVKPNDGVVVQFNRYTKGNG